MGVCVFKKNTNILIGRDSDWQSHMHLLGLMGGGGGAGAERWAEMGKKKQEVSLCPGKKKCTQVK